MICVTCRNFEYLMRYGKSATSGGGTGKVMTSSDSYRRGLSNDMRHVPPFWIFNEIRIIGDIRRFDAGSIDVIGLSSARAFEWYASRSVILNISWDTENRQHPKLERGKWWRHRTHLCEGFRIICVTIRHFEYLMRYKKTESDDVIGLRSERAFEWNASRAAILNI